MRRLELSHRVYRVWQRNRDVFGHLWRTEVPLFLLEPLFMLIALGFGLGAYVILRGGGSYLKFLAPGILGIYVMSSASFECTYGSYVRMEIQRTFEAIIATPVSLDDVIAGEICWAATRSLMTACAVLLVMLFFGLLSTPWVLLSLPLALLAGLLFGSLAMLFTSLAPTINSFNYYFTLFVTPTWLFSGVFFPLSDLPAVVQGLAQVLPLTPIVRLFRALNSGELAPWMLADLAWVLVITGLGFFLSLYSMHRRLIK